MGKVNGRAAMSKAVELFILFIAREAGVKASNQPKYIDQRRRAEYGSVALQQSRGMHFQQPGNNCGAVVVDLYLQGVSDPDDGAVVQGRCYDVKTAGPITKSRHRHHNEFSKVNMVWKAKTAFLKVNSVALCRNVHPKDEYHRRTAVIFGNFLRGTIFLFGVPIFFLLSENRKTETFFAFCNYISNTRPGPIAKRISGVPNCDLLIFKKT